MKQKAKRFCIGIIAAVMLITFSACTVEGPNDNFVTPNRTPDPTPRDLRGIITISGYRSAEYDESLMGYIGEIALEYLGLEVQYDDQYTEEEYFSTLDARIASGDIGDVYLVRDDQIASLAESGKILDLTDYLNSFYSYEPYEKVEMSETVFPAAYQSAMYNGKLYMVPTEYNHKFVFLNYDMLREAGVSKIPDDKWTWDDFKTYADAVTAHGGKIIMDYTDYAIWGSFVKGFGGSLRETTVAEDGSIQEGTAVSLTGNNTLAGLNELVSFVKNHNVEKELGSLDMSQVGLAVVDRYEMGMWKNSTESEYFDWSLVDYEWDFMHFPRFETHSVGAHSVGFVVSSDFTDAEAERRDLAANVAMYALFTAPSRAYVNSGEIVPAQKSVSEEKFWREYPVKGKNTSVFTNYYTSDFSASLTSVFSLSVANKLTIGNAVEQAANGADLAGLLRSIQNSANAAQ